MTEDAHRGWHNKKRLWLALAALLLVLAVLIVPPLFSIGRYKSRVTQLISTSLGRPVRLSSVNLRVLPRPGFVLTDLTVEEDPEFGAEPVLHASTVTAYIRLLSLWRGRLEISTISVDEASLNLVRSKEGRWNLDPLFRTAAAKTTGKSARPRPLPYLEATNSRVNIKSGFEKLPFSLVNADLSFWQENPGDWRVRLRGQPARTDVSLDLADTGIVQMEASLSAVPGAPVLHNMPVHLDLEWREAQLGQLSRLVLGADPGWRGDLTGELHLDGTAESAQVKTRLRATGVHRAEFAPAVALDFDANCTFAYHYSVRSVDDLSCDSPLGDGHFRILGSLPANAPPKLSVELQRIPVQAGLDALRTLRSGIDDSLEARGTIGGKLTYDPTSQPEPAQQAAPANLRHSKAAPAKAHPVPEGPFQGTLTVDSFALNGAGLSQPIQIPRFALEPVPIPDGQPQKLAASINVPAGGPAPLAVVIQFTATGYQISFNGSASLARMREWAHVAGIARATPLDALAGEPATLDLRADGPWLPKPGPAIAEPAIASAGPLFPESMNPALHDVLRGTVTLHNVNWKSDALASHVEISQAVLHLGSGQLLWDPIAFTYGPMKGTATLNVPLACVTDQPCPPQLTLHFAQLDAGKLQAALLGAEKQDTLLSTLIDRLTKSEPPVWPRIDVTMAADSLVLGPFNLQNATAGLRILPTSAELSSFDGAFLGGQITLTGNVANGAKPVYELEGKFSSLQAPAVCKLLALHCSGGALDGNGKIKLAGFADKDLASSADGALHFDWRRGSFAKDPLLQLPSALVRFDRFTADAVIANGAITLKQNQIQQGRRKSAINSVITFGDPPKVSFAASKAKSE